MRAQHSALWVLGPTALLLAGCHGSATSFGERGKSQGRYAGIGTYDAGKLWAQMPQQAPADPAAATAGSALR